MTTRTTRIYSLIALVLLVTTAVLIEPVAAAFASGWLMLGYSLALTRAER